MPESPIVPHGRVIRPVPLPDGALDQIRVRARRRRAARTTAIASACVTTAVLAAATLTINGIGDRDDDTLRIGPATELDRGVVVPAPQTSPVPEAATGDDAAETGAGGHQHEAALGSQKVPAAQEARPVVAPGAAAPADTAQPQSKRTRRTPSYDDDAMRSSHTAVFPSGCGPLGGGAIGGWCVDGWVDTGGTRLIFSACRADGYGGGTLEWTTTQQVRFEVRTARGALVWRYDPQVRPDPSSEHVPAQGCQMWHVPWEGRDEQGRALPSSRYTLHAASTAHTLRAAWVKHEFTHEA